MQLILYNFGTEDFSMGHIFCLKNCTQKVSSANKTEEGILMGQRDRNLGLSKSSFLEKLSEMSAKLFGGASLKSMIFLIPKKRDYFQAAPQRSKS